MEKSQNTRNPNRVHLHLYSKCVLVKVTLHPISLQSVFRRNERYNLYMLQRRTFYMLKFTMGLMYSTQGLNIPLIPFCRSYSNSFQDLAQINSLSGEQLAEIEQPTYFYLIHSQHLLLVMFNENSFTDLVTYQKPLRCSQQNVQSFANGSTYNP